MPPRTLNPQYSQWLKDFFATGGDLPTLLQGLPAYEEEGYDVNPEDYLNLFGIEEGLRPPEGIISDYPEHKEKYEVIDFLLGGEKVREAAETERFKLQDLLESIQTTGPEKLRIGGVSKDLESQREGISKGLANIEAKRAFGLKAEEIELAQNVYGLRQDYEKQVTGDYLDWLSRYMPPPEEAGGLGEGDYEGEGPGGDICTWQCSDGCSYVGECPEGQASGTYMTTGTCCEGAEEAQEDECSPEYDIAGRCVYCCPDSTSCFHPDSTVELEDGTVKTMREVKYGDKVKAVDKDGNIIFSEVWEDMYFNLKDNTQKKYYITIKAGGKTLKVTTMHTVFVDNLKKNMNSQKIKPGMFVNVLEGNKIVPKMVDSVNHSMEIGKYDLYTKEGTVIVDGIVTGTLAFLPHRIAQWWHKFFNNHPRMYRLAYKYIYSPLFHAFYPKKEEHNLRLQTTSN